MFWEFSVRSSYCNAILSLLSIFAIVSLRTGGEVEVSWLLDFNGILLSSGCYSFSLPYGVPWGCSAVYGYGNLIKHILLCINKGIGYKL